MGLVEGIFQSYCLSFVAIPWLGELENSVTGSSLFRTAVVQFLHHYDSCLSSGASTPYGVDAYFLLDIKGRPVATGVRLVRSNPHPLSRQQYMYTVTVVVLAVNSLTFLSKYKWICTKMSHHQVKKSQNFLEKGHRLLPRPDPPLGRRTPLPQSIPYPLSAYGMSGYGPEGDEYQ